LWKLGETKIIKVMKIKGATREAEGEGRGEKEQHRGDND
jgi:hypothetical protein